MALFSTSASNQAENEAWMANLRATDPPAYDLYSRLLAAATAKKNASNKERGRAGSYGPLARAQAAQAAQYDALSKEWVAKYPQYAAYTSTHGQSTGGLGQGADIIASAVGLLGGAAALSGAGAAEGAAGTAGSTAGTGAATGTAGTTAGTAAGTGAGYSGLTDAAIESGVSGGVGSGTAAGTAGATSASGGGFWSGVGDFLGSQTGQGLLNLGAGYLQGEQNQQAANTYANQQLEAARIAAEAARFKPVGVTTRFGQSDFKFDDKGNLVSAGYTLSPEMKAQQDAIMRAITGSQQGMMQPQNRAQPVSLLPNGQPNYQYSIGLPQNPNQQPMPQIAGARANGGPVAGGQTYLVGERGPELFTAPASGGIVPNEQLNYAGGTPGFYGGGGQSMPTGFNPNPSMPNLQTGNQPTPGMMYAGGTPGFYGGGQTMPAGLNVANPSAAAPISITPFTGNQDWIGAPELNPNNPTNPNYRGGPVSVLNNNQPTGLLGQAVGAQQTTAPLSQGSQSLFNLGQGYLGTSPQEQAAKYMQEQQALLAPTRERQQAALENRLQQQGRSGLAMGATGTMGAANPEMEAFYNAQRQQDLALAAQSTQGGQQYAQFGAGLLGTGGEMLRGMYGTQTAAYQPYQTALGLTQQIEGLGQNAMDIGVNLGAKGAAAGTNVGSFLQGGAARAGEVQLPANQYNPWVGLLQGAANWY